jgi:hypothetical protein
VTRSRGMIEGEGGGGEGRDYASSRKKVRHSARLTKKVEVLIGVA